MNKKSLRSHFSKLREQETRNTPNAGQMLADRINPTDYCSDIVAGYMATPDELDPAALLSAIGRNGACIALPRINQSGTMQFCLADPARMETGSLGIIQPDKSCPEAQPDVIFLPLVACTRAGVRLGRGGGHYDRALAAMDANQHHHLRVGLAFDAQIADNLPCEPHDQLLHRIETPTHTVRIN